jgi:hypothetical protein
MFSILGSHWTFFQVTSCGNLSFVYFNWTLVKSYDNIPQDKKINNHFFCNCVKNYSKYVLSYDFVKLYITIRAFFFKCILFLDDFFVKDYTKKKSIIIQFINWTGVIYNWCQFKIKLVCMFLEYWCFNFFFIVIHGILKTHLLIQSFRRSNFYHFYLYHYDNCRENTMLISTISVNYE